MEEMLKANLSLEQVSKLKRQAVGGRPYVDRISLQFAARLVWIAVELGEGDLVLHELDHLECLHSRRSLTKPETQFKHAPLHPLWHKHYSAARHMPKNLSTRWGLYADGNRDAIKMLQGMVTPTASDDTEKLVGNILHRMVVSGYEERAERGLTGDWIIFGRQNGLNYYLDVVPHSEAPEHAKLYEHLRKSCAAEFPAFFTKG